MLVTVLSVALGCVSQKPVEQPLIDYYLVVSDTIGVAEGDANYLLVWPVDARYTPERDIAVVDMMKNTILFYTPEGEFIRCVGAEGFAGIEASISPSGHLVTIPYGRYIDMITISGLQDMIQE